MKYCVVGTEPSALVYSILVTSTTTGPGGLVISAKVFTSKR